jgi:uncharacterized membrane protein
MESITFQPILSYWALGLVFLLATLMLLVGPSFVKLTKSQRWTLGGLRLGLLALVLLATLRPGCVQQIEKNQAAILMFLVDTTRSMQLPHIGDDTTRWGAVEEVVEENKAKFEKLIESKIDVQFFGFDNQVASLEIIDGVVTLPEEPEGGETDIGSAIYETSLNVRDQRLLGVFVMSDGVQNVLDPPVELTQAAETLNDMEVPLYSVLLGLDGSSQLRDIAITNFAEQQIVNVNNELTAKATLVSRGYPNQDITVDLILIDRAGKETLVKSTVVRPVGNYAETNIKLDYKPKIPGEFRLKIRANPMPDELAVRNNELDAFLTVNDRGMTVLYVSGDVSNEQRFLRDSLPTTGFIKLDFQPVFPSSRDRWPLVDFEELFKDPSYDVFIIGDLDSRAFHDPNAHTRTLQALADAVYGGKGLLMLGGYHSFGAGFYHQTPLADVLPIVMDRTEGQEFGQDVRRDLHVNAPFKVRPAKDHYLTRIGLEEGNTSTWSKLPPLVGANRIAVKDNAEVLLESDDDVERPILVSTDVGGRVLAFAGDSTWRWRMPRIDPEPSEAKDYKAEYDQFWRQIILWLAFWDSRKDESVSIELPQRRFQPKARIKFDVTVKTVNGEVVNDATFNAALVAPDGERQVIAINQKGDRYFSNLDPESVSESGLYLLEVEGLRAGESIGKSMREFIVMDRDKEKSNPVANPDQMRRLASQTAEHGGRGLAPEEVSDLLDDLIENPPVTKIEIPVRWRLGETFPDAAGFLITFVLLLTIEWLLRKKWGLV